jgi:peptidoglycan/LPS O-acetylase OafA/YrhL
MTLGAGLSYTKFTYYLQNKEWALSATWIINNFFLVGQDILRFFYFDELAGHFTALPASVMERQELYAHLDPAPLSIMPQSWTLAIELYFYLLAPLLLVRSTGTLAIAVIALFVLRVLLGYAFDPTPELLYGFFPTELPLFLSGSLAYRAYTYLFESSRLLHMLGRVNAGEKTLSLLCAVVVAGVCWIFLACELNFVTTYAPNRLLFLAAQWGNVPLYAPTGYWLILVMTVGILPFAFHFSRKFPFDRYIGELSYPIYISHLCIVEFINQKLHPEPDGQAYIGLAVLASSIVLSMVLVEFIEKPIDRLRHRLAGVGDEKEAE